MVCSTKFKLYAVMVLMNFLSAWYDTCFGSRIPYFSAATGIDETDYSYLFMVRSAANILGGFVVKFLIKRISTQTLAITYMLVVLVSLCLSTLSLSTVNLAITLFIATGAFVGVSVIAFSITLKLFLQDEPDYWVQLLQFFFAVGALSGQFFVVLFEQTSFIILGFAHLIPIIGVIVYPLPSLNEDQTDHDKKGLQLSTKSVIYVCMIFFFFATVELGVASWIPTYSIKSGVADVKSSTIFSMFFWVPNCFTRLFWIYLPGTINTKLGWSLKTVFVAALIAVILQYFQLFNIVCYFTPISIGILISGVYGFCLALVVDNGFAFSPQNNATFVLSNAVGEGLFITPMGYTMGLLGFKSMIIQIGLFALFALIAWSLAIKSMEQDKNQYQIVFPEEQNRQQKT